MQICTTCGAEKPTEAFGKSHQRGKTYQMRRCRDCVNIRQRARYSKEKARGYRANKIAAHPDHKVREHLSHRYGITLEQYEELLASQGGRCAVCESASPNRPGTRRFHLDHYHETGEIRGLICHRCNTGIGLFQDNADVVERAAAYLRFARTGLIAKRTYSYGATEVLKHHR